MRRVWGIVWKMRLPERRGRVRLIEAKEAHVRRCAHEARSGFGLECAGGLDFPSSDLRNESFAPASSPIGLKQFNENFVDSFKMNFQKFIFEMNFQRILQISCEHGPTSLEDSGRRFGNQACSEAFAGLLVNLSALRGRALLLGFGR
jgi:hypothetical protein